MDSEGHIHEPSTWSMDGMCFHQLLIQVDVCLCVNDKLRDTYSGCLRVGQFFYPGVDSCGEDVTIPTFQNYGDMVSLDCVLDLGRIV